MTMLKSLKNNWKLAIIIFLAFFLRCAVLIKYGDFWDDEMFNYVYSQKHWPQGLYYWLWETNPPLHLLILKIWFFIVPATEFFARIPGVIAGTATVFVLYIFGKNLFDKNIALFASLYLALHPYHIFWSATARIYIFLMLLALLSSIYFFKIYINKERNGKNLLYQKIINFFLLMSHLSALFFVVGQIILLFIIQGFDSAKQWIKDNIIPLALAGLWIILAIGLKFNNNLSNSWFLNIKHTYKSALNPLINLIAGQFNFWAGIILIILFLIIFLKYFLSKKITKEEKIKLGSLAFLTIFPILIAFAFGIWHIKFFVSILPLFILIFVVAIKGLIKNAYYPFLLIICFCSIGLFNLFNTLPLSDWNYINKYINNHSQINNTVFIYNNYILKTQIDMYLPQLKVPAIPLVLYENMSWDDMVVKKNYLFTTLDENEKNSWYEINKLDEYGRIVLLEGEYDYMNKLKSIFAEHGWKMIKGPDKSGILGNYYLYVFERNI